MQNRHLKVYVKKTLRLKLVQIARDFSFLTLKARDKQSLSVFVAKNLNKSLNTQNIRYEQTQTMHCLLYCCEHKEKSLVNY